MKNEILTFNDLENCVESDVENHSLKHCAKLFLSAINDWPTNDIKSISQFVTELENYYGKPLTKENIENKKLNILENNAWRHESGSSISEMISVAEKYNRETNFENIIANILKFYGNKSF